jgi:hypothetical protein
MSGDCVRGRRAMFQSCEGALLEFNSKYRNYWIMQISGWSRLGGFLIAFILNVYSLTTTDGLLNVEIFPS